MSVEELTRLLNLAKAAVPAEVRDEVDDIRDLPMLVSGMVGQWHNDIRRNTLRGRRGKSYCSF
jgi:hypothetical protein